MAETNELSKQARKLVGQIASLGRVAEIVLEVDWVKTKWEEFFGVDCNGIGVSYSGNLEGGESFGLDFVVGRDKGRNNRSTARDYQAAVEAARQAEDYFARRGVKTELRVDDGLRKYLE